MKKWIQSLPSNIRHLAHLECMQDTLISDQKKLEYWKKFNIEHKDRDWIPPRGNEEK